MKGRKRSLQEQARYVDQLHQLTQCRAVLVAHHMERCRDAVRASGSPWLRSAVAAGSGLATGLLLGGKDTDSYPGQNPPEERPHPDSAPVKLPPRDGNPEPRKAPRPGDDRTGDVTERLLQATYAMGLSVLSKTLYSAVVNPYLERLDLKVDDSVGQAGDG